MDFKLEFIEPRLISSTEQKPNRMMVLYPSLENINCFFTCVVYFKALQPRHSWEHCLVVTFSLVF